MQAASQDTSISKGRLWTGRVLSTLIVLFLLFDAFGKLAKPRQVIDACTQLGLPVHLLPIIGTILLVFTILYAIPRTAPLGALLLTGYLGGAVAIQMRIGNPMFENIFPVIFAVILWAGLLLRDDRLHILALAPKHPK